MINFVRNAINRENLTTILVLALLILLISLLSITVINYNNYLTSNNPKHQNNILDDNVPLTKIGYPFPGISPTLIEVKISPPPILSGSKIIPSQLREYANLPINAFKIDFKVPNTNFPYQIQDPLTMNYTLTLQYISVHYIFGLYYKYAPINTESGAFNFTYNGNSEKLVSYILNMNNFKFNDTGIPDSTSKNYYYREFFVGYRYYVTFATGPINNNSLTFSSIFYSTISDLQVFDLNSLNYNLTNIYYKEGNLAVFYPVSTQIKNLIREDEISMSIIIPIIFIGVRMVRRSRREKQQERDLYPTYKKTQ